MKKYDKNYRFSYYVGFYNEKQLKKGFPRFYKDEKDWQWIEQAIKQAREDFKKWLLENDNIESEHKLKILEILRIYDKERLKLTNQNK